jgi:hypothetical protein
MKKIKNLVYIALLSLLVVSCEDNTESITNPGESILPVEIKVSFTDTNTSAEVTEGETASFRIGMPAAVAGTVEVSINVTSSDGEVEATYPTSVTFENGQSAEYIEIVTEDDGNVESEVYTVEITGVSVVLDSNVPFFIHNGEAKRTIGVKDVPTPIVTTAGDLVFKFTWAGAGNDLDCRLTDLAFTLQYSTGYSTSPGESVTLADAVPDGDYTFRLRPWTVVDSSIAYNIDVEAPTETRPYSGTFLDLAGGWSMEIIVLTINKTTRGTVVTYLITQE